MWRDVFTPGLYKDVDPGNISINVILPRTLDKEAKTGLILPATVLNDTITSDVIVVLNCPMNAWQVYFPCTYWSYICELMLHCIQIQMDNEKRHMFYCTVPVLYFELWLKPTQNAYSLVWTFLNYCVEYFIILKGKTVFSIWNLIL